MNNENWDFKGTNWLEKGVALSDFTAAAAHWSVLLFDVRGSTQAIADGRYRQVNMAGAMCLASAFNFFGRNDFPFVFGGDGATILLPTHEIPRYLPVLQSLISRVRREFQLELRVGYVEIAELRKLGAEVVVRKRAITKAFARCDFLGGGFDLAEDLIKKEKAPAVVLKVQSDADDADLSLTGLECRWEPIHSRAGEFYSVIIRPSQRSPSESNKVIEEILMALPVDRTPGAEQLKLTMDPRKLVSEILAHAKKSMSSYEKKWALVRLWVATIYGRLAMALGLRDADGFKWGEYRQQVINNTDFIKIDDALRFVLDLSPEKGQKLTTLLDRLEAQGAITYAIHRSTQAQLTCFVGTLTEDHIHFIDGSDGGYAAAAKELKKKIALKSTRAFTE
jgi:hypothetical protein